MPIGQIVESGLLLFVLLNPFLLSVYLLDLITELDAATFRRVLVRGTAISTTVFVLFACAGDVIFSRVLQVRFAAFLMFGGIVFLIVGVRYVMVGSEAIRSLRGAPEHMAGSIAMPFMIGPGTVSASVLAGSRLPYWWAATAIIGAMSLSVVSMFVLKALHDVVRVRNAKFVDRYVDIVGRISALIIGTLAVEMIFQAVDLWLQRVDA